MGRSNTQFAAGTIWHEYSVPFARHGVTFPEAAEVFFDPFYISGDASTKDEAREYIIGASLLTRTVFVVYVERGERTRIISARPATRAEKKLYENGE